MYHLDDLVSEVVTIKASNGLEIIATLLAVDDELTTITISHPRTVVLNEQTGEMALVPFVYTADTPEVFMSLNNVLAVIVTSDITKTDYNDIIAKYLEEDSNEDLVEVETVTE